MAQVNVEAICNQALDVIGYKRHIGSVWDGTPAARVALDLYSETRDEVLVLRPWPFAVGRYTITPTTDGPAPDYPWLYKYIRPISPLKILDVYPGGMDYAAIMKVEPVRWLERFDLALRARVIWTEFTAARAVVIESVDEPEVFSPEFIATLVQALAEKFQRALVGAPQRQQSGEGKE